jgi:hypothetical protein
MAAAAGGGAQILGQALEGGQRGDESGLLLGGHARQAFGDDGGALGGDPVVPPTALWGDLNPCGAEVFRVTQAADQAERVELADHPGQHGGVQTLDLGEFGKAQRPADGDYAEHRRLGRGEPFAGGGGLQLAGEPQHDAPEPDYRVLIHA